MSLIGLKTLFRAPLFRVPVLAAFGLLASLLSTQLSAQQQVEIYLLDRIDGVLNHFCVDTNGPPHAMQLDTPLQTHTCYSYRGELSDDQAMNTEDIASGKLRIAAVDLCAQLDATEPGATVTLAECTEAQEQSFELRENGNIVSVPYPHLCLTAGPTSSFGGPLDDPNEFQARTLHMQRCGEEADRYQRWGARSETPAP